MPQIRDVNERGEPRMMSGGGKGVGREDIRMGAVTACASIAISPRKDEAKAGGAAHMSTPHKPASLAGGSVAGGLFAPRPRAM
jgi:hypothetical protein